MFKYLKKHNQIVISALLMLVILLLKIPFHTAVIVLLEFIVIIEIVKMISSFIKNHRVRLRDAIDIFIIFLIRDIVILTSNSNKEYYEIVFLIGVVFSFFIFRILSLKYSPSTQYKNAPKNRKYTKTTLQTTPKVNK